MKLPPLLPAIFIKRINRFVGEILINGKLEKALVRNTGRMKELLKCGNAVFVRKKEKGRCKYEIILARAEKSLVCVESHYANKLFEEYAKNFLKVKKLKREVNINGKRFDFLIDNTVVEVKSINLVKNNVALFPDAPTERGRRHVKELIKISKTYKPLLVFVVMREDFECFLPNCETDKKFCEIFYEYMKKGLEVKVLKCKVSLSEIKITEEKDVCG